MIPKFFCISCSGARVVCGPASRSGVLCCDVDSRPQAPYSGCGLWLARSDRVNWFHLSPAIQGVILDRIARRVDGFLAACESSIDGVRFRQMGGGWSMDWMITEL